MKKYLPEGEEKSTFDLALKINTFYSPCRHFSIFSLTTAFSLPFSVPKNFFFVQFFFKYQGCTFEDKFIFLFEFREMEYFFLRVRRHCLGMARMVPREIPPFCVTLCAYTSRRFFSFPFLRLYANFF